jgi:DNA processing protein
MENHDQLRLAGLIRAEVFSPLELRGLIDHFGGIAPLLDAPTDALTAVGLTGDKLTRFLSRRKGIDAETEAVRLTRENVVVIPDDDPLYPPLLAEIPDAPPLLFVRGDPAALSLPHPLTVVGSRRLTAYGRAALRELVSPLARAGALVLSGLAFGADAAAHALALDCGAPTVAVLASGVDRDCVGPRANFRLAEEIVRRGGCLVSEYPPGVHADKPRFPQRNRLLAGLARVVLVIEAAEKSGSLITGRLAMDFNRALLAVPGPITSPLSAGTNRLIASGARPALAAADIVEELRLVLPAAPTAPVPADPAQASVAAALADGPASTDDICNKTGRPVRDVIAALSGLETLGLAGPYGDTWTLLRQ